MREANRTERFCYGCGGEFVPEAVTLMVQLNEDGLTHAEEQRLIALTADHTPCFE